MGRHAAPEQRRTVDRTSGWQWPDRAAQRQVDPVQWWQAATPKRRAQAAAWVVLPAVGLIAAVSGSSGGSSATVSPTAAASQAGTAFGNQMREAGYNSMSIETWCVTKSGGYSGDQMQAYQLSCFDVGMALAQNGG